MTSPDVTRPAYENAYRQAYTLPRRVVPYRITFALDLFNGRGDRQLSRDTLDVMLRNLLEIDMLYLRHHPETPPLYRSGVRYMEEPPGQEDWQDIPTTLRLGIGDCIPATALVVSEGYRLRPIGLIAPGDTVLANGVWTKVTEACFTGSKPILALDLANGCTLRASEDHRVWVNGEERRLRDVRVGESLRTPDKPFPVAEKPFHPIDEVSATDFAWLVGTYIADGWGEPYRFSISGFDTRPKRRKIEQKERVRAICEAAGISTRWATKYIEVHHGALARFMKECGGTAPVKQLPTLDWSAEQILQVIEGLLTDASTANSGTMTHGTVSSVLALQTRLLYRMLNQSVHIRLWSAEEHKGLGRNGMYRITVRRPASDGYNATWKTRAEDMRTSTRVRAIRQEAPEECCDITTEAGEFYLPESDVMAHNCEDIACWRAAEYRVRLGVEATPIFREQRRADGSYLYHIVVKLPPNAQYPSGAIEDPCRALGMK